MIFSCHPRTLNKLKEFNVSINNIRACEPFGFFDFVYLEKKAFAILTDSGTVQEEACILNIPSITIRDSTERPETLECGSNILSGLKSKDIVNCFNIIKNISGWDLPEGYKDNMVSTKVVNFLLGSTSSTL